MDSNGTCLAVISLDSALKKDENYYPEIITQDIFLATQMKNSFFL